MLLRQRQGLCILASTVLQAVQLSFAAASLSIIPHGEHAWEYGGYLAPLYHGDCLAGHTLRAVPLILAVALLKA